MTKPDRWGKGRGGRPWRRLVEAVKLRDSYTCQKCGAITEIGECDHIVPVASKGADDLTNLQWLCLPCHQAKTAVESGEGQVHPHWLPAPACKVVLVTGPPGAGKTTYCKEHAKREDCIVDLDECFERVCGVHGHTAAREHLGAALRLRNMMLADLASKRKGIAYVIVSAPTEQECVWWRTKLKAEHVSLDPGPVECGRRVAANRRHLVGKWYAAQAADKPRKLVLSRAERRAQAGDHWSR